LFSPAQGRESKYPAQDRIKQNYPMNNPLDYQNLLNQSTEGVFFRVFESPSYKIKHTKLSFHTKFHTKLSRQNKHTILFNF